jgi:hypothetical protein
MVRIRLFQIVAAHAGFAQVLAALRGDRRNFAQRTDSKIVFSVAKLQVFLEWQVFVQQHMLENVVVVAVGKSVQDDHRECPWCAHRITRCGSGIVGSGIVGSGIVGSGIVIKASLMNSRCGDSVHVTPRAFGRSRRRVPVTTDSFYPAIVPAATVLKRTRPGSAVPVL